jgi:hypothetical protein
MLIYTNIQHIPRKKFWLSLNEYVLCDMIYHLSNDNKFWHWCFCSKDALAKELWITKRTVMNLITKLIEKWFIIKNKDTKFVKTTQKWFENMVQMTDCNWDWINTDIEVVKKEEEEEEIIEDKRDFEINLIIETLKDLNNWIIDGTQKQQRQYWKHLKTQISKLEWFNGDYVWFIKTLYELSPPFNIKYFSGVSKFYYHLAEIISWVKQEVKAKKINII